MVIDLLSAPILLFGAVFVRLSGLFLALPVLAVEIAPVRIRALLTAFLALGFSAPLPAVPLPASWAGPLLLEFLVGAAMGMVIRVAFATLDFAGEAAGMQMGFGFNRMVDPLSGEEIGPITSIASMVGTLTLFVGEGYQEILRAFAGSLRVIPPWQVTFQPDWAEFIGTRIGLLFVLGLKIAAPLILVVLATQLTFGVLNRIAPRLNPFALGFVTSIGAGLMALVVFMPNIALEIEHMLQDNLAAVTALLDQGS